MKYPKVKTLFNRSEENFKVIVPDFTLKEFESIKHWHVTEKIDGTNIRVMYEPETVRFTGRTDKAEIYQLLEYLEETFTEAKLEKVFLDPLPPVILYGEGYGGKIQKAGKQYRDDVAFRLFDVWIPNPEAKMRGWWLEPDDIWDVARKLSIETVPVLGMMTTEKLVDYVKGRQYSWVSSEDGGNREFEMEGVVGRTIPLMFTRKGQRVMCKLKVKDFLPEELG